eukprot:5568748-Amphidinium_carterae.1
MMVMMSDHAAAGHDANDPTIVLSYRVQVLLPDEVLHAGHLRKRDCCGHASASIIAYILHFICVFFASHTLSKCSRFLVAISLDVCHEEEDEEEEDE